MSGKLRAIVDDIDYESELPSEISSAVTGVLDDIEQQVKHIIILFGIVKAGNFSALDDAASALSDLAEELY